MVIIFLYYVLPLQSVCFEACEVMTVSSFMDWASWTAHSLSSTSSREWDPTVQLPQALKIALNFPSLCMCSLELQPCWMSQLLQGDIAAEIRPGLCKEKPKDPLVASWEIHKRSKDESVTHFLSPCWLLTTLGNPQGCVGIKSHLSKSSSCTFSGNKRWRTHNSFESRPWSQNSSWEVVQPWWGCARPGWVPASPPSSKPREKEAPSNRLVWHQKTFPRFLNCLVVTASCCTPYASVKGIKGPLQMSW